MKTLSVLWNLVLLFCLLVACVREEKVNKLGLNTKVEKIRFRHNFPKVDILIAIDSDNLMPSYQQNLIADIGQLIRPIQENQIIDFQIGVITTTMSTEADGTCDKDGRLIGHPRYLTRETPNTEQALQKNLQQEESNCHPLTSRNRPFAAVAAALSTPLVHGYNNRLYRPDASLAVVFVTDTAGNDDDMSFNKFKNFLIDLKRGDSEKIVLHGAIVEKDDPFNCLGNDHSKTAPTKIETVVTHFAGRSFNLCSPFFDQELARLGNDLDDRFGELFIPLKQVPASGTITVSYKGRPLQKIYQDGWTYDPNRKGIRVGKKIKLPTGISTGFLEISFFPADLDDDGK